MVEQEERTRITESGKNCAIQGVRLIWKQNIWLVICEFLWSLTNQNAWFLSSFCTELTLLHFFSKKKCTVLNQSEWENFFMYIIRYQTSRHGSKFPLCRDNEVAVSSVKPIVRVMGSALHQNTDEGLMLKFHAMGLNHHHHNLVAGLKLNSSFHNTVKCELIWIFSCWEIYIEANVMAQVPWVTVAHH